MEDLKTNESFTNEVKTKWLEALKSGKYKQGTSQLLIDNSYCCLAVLGVELGLKIDWEGMDFTCANKFNDTEGKTVYPSLSPYLPKLTQIRLYEINDKNISFDAVIKVIKELPTK